MHSAFRSTKVWISTWRRTDKGQGGAGVQVLGRRPSGAGIVPIGGGAQIEPAGLFGADLHDALVLQALVILGVETHAVILRVPGALEAGAGRGRLGLLIGIAALEAILRGAAGQQIKEISVVLKAFCEGAVVGRVLVLVRPVHLQKHGKQQCDGDRAAEYGAVSLSAGLEALAAGQHKKPEQDHTQACQRRHGAVHHDAGGEDGDGLQKDKGNAQAAGMESGAEIGGQEKAQQQKHKAVGLDQVCVGVFHTRVGDMGVEGPGDAVDQILQLQRGAAVIKAGGHKQKSGRKRHADPDAPPIGCGDPEQHAGEQQKYPKRWLHGAGKAASQDLELADRAQAEQKQVAQTVQVLAHFRLTSPSVIRKIQRAPVASKAQGLSMGFARMVQKLSVISCSLAAS